jgi:ABC-type glycerol-3-phosphate transport system substrate-binding protein
MLSLTYRWTVGRVAPPVAASPPREKPSTAPAPSSHSPAAMNKPLLSSAPALLLAACATLSAAPVTINVAMEAGRMADAANSVVPEFQAQNPEIKVNVVPLPYTTFQQKVTTELSAGSGAYDVIETHMLMLAPMVAAKQVLPLDKYIKSAEIDVSDFLKSIMDQARLYGQGKQLNPEGEIYGLPYNSDVYMFVYRKDLFDELGFNPADPWENAVQHFAALTKQKNIAGFAFSGARRDNSHLIYDFYNIALNLDGTLPIGANLQPTMNSPGNLKALQILAQIVRDGSAPKGVMEYRYDDKNTALAQGIAASMSQWMLACYKSVNDPSASKVAGKVGFAAPPGGKACTGGWVASVVAKTKHPEAAFKFISFLTNEKNNLKLALEFGNGPTRKSVIDSPEFKQAYPFAEAMRETLTQGTHFTATAPQIALWSEITDIITDRLADAIFEQTKPEDALKQADDQVARLLRQSGYAR